ncbi:hypothetical protein NDU88_000777 [Pleurodeles waltl]|uniref:Uncharacterized protein n=1 Tax=Pleurodeles waltl TaxID=8319 RepID=A0AAV7Q2C9_PLEWA|nr:hypothetical protein NDU88_000777 [Pleurodeles waltl]
MRERNIAVVLAIFVSFGRQCGRVGRHRGTQQFQHDHDTDQDTVFKGLEDFIDSAGDGARSLHLIYQTMMAQHKQTQGDNRKARVATKQLQVAEKRRTVAISAAQTELALLEMPIMELARNNLPLQDVLDQTAAMKARIAQMYLDRDIIKAQTREQDCYEFSEKVGKLLAHKTRQKAPESLLP